MTATPSLPDLDAFDYYARQAVLMYPTLRVLQFVDTNGVIVHEFPVEGNESALGLDLKPLEDWSFLEETRRLRRTIIRPNPGPIVQDSLGSIIRTPLYREDVFLGWAQGVYDVENLMHGTESQLSPRQLMQMLDSEEMSFLAANEYPTVPLAFP